MLYGKIIADCSEIRKHHRNTSDGGMNNDWILSPEEFIETTGLERVKCSSICSSMSIVIGIMQVGVKTDYVYHFILWYLCPFLPCESSYHIAPNIATIIYHNTNLTGKDLIPFNVTTETYSCDEKPAAAIQGHLTEDVTLQINRPLGCCDSLRLPAQLGWTTQHPHSPYLQPTRKPFNLLPTNDIRNRLIQELNKMPGRVKRNSNKSNLFTVYSRI